MIAGFIKAKGTSPVAGGDRLTLLRDSDGDGTYEGKTVFAESLNAPYGLALVGNNLYVDLQIPRQTLVFPNGDILVAEGRGGGAPRLTVAMAAIV